MTRSETDAIGDPAGGGEVADGEAGPVPTDRAQHDVPGTEALPEALPVAAAPAPRFCGTCGAAWEEGWRECGACVPAGARGGGSLESDESDIRGVKSAVGLYFALLAVCMVGLVTGFADAYTLTVEVGVTVALCVVVSIWAAFHWREVVPTLTRTPGVKWLAASVGMGVATFGVAMGFIGGLDLLLDLPEDDVGNLFLEAGYGWGMVVLAIAVQPAVFEEVAFRGVVNGALSRVLGAGETIAVGALMFMILHLAPARFPHTLAMGVAAGFLRLRTGSLYPCILLHFVHNGLCVLVEYAEWA